MFFFFRISALNCINCQDIKVLKYVVISNLKGRHTFAFANNPWYDKN